MLETTIIESNYTGNGSATSFHVGFDFLTAADIEVAYLTDDEVTSIKTLGVEYNVTGSNVVFVTAPTNGQALRLKRVTNGTQTVDLNINGPWNPDAVERMVDRVAMGVQEAKAAIAAIEASIDDVEPPTIGPGIVYVSDFDAVGDGVTDDTAAIQAAIDSLRPGGGTVSLFGGTFLTTAALRLSASDHSLSNVRLTGLGQAASKIKIKTGYTHNGIEAKYGSDFEVDNLTVEGNGDAAPIYCGNWQPGESYPRAGVRYSTRAGGAYASPPASTDVVWTVSTAMPSGVESDPDENDTLDGADLTYFTAVTPGPTVLNKHDYDLTFTTRHGIYFSGERGVAAVDKVYIHDVTVENTTYGGIVVGSGSAVSTIVEEGVTNARITNCLTSNTGAAGIGGVRRKRAVINGNTVLGSGSNGINVDDSGEDNIITSNVVDGLTAESTTTFYTITAATVTGAGSSYVVGDQISLGVSTGTSYPAILRVDTINGGGGILTFTVLSVGRFSVSPTATVSGGSGSGATFTLTVVTEAISTYVTRNGISCYGSSRNIVSNNVVRRCQYGINLNGLGTDIGSIVSTNNITDCTVAGITSTSCENSQISDNIVRATGALGVSVKNTNNVVVASNVIKDLTGTGAQGIRFQNSYGMSVVNNTVRDVFSVGIRLRGCRRSTIQSNAVYNCGRRVPSAAILLDDTPSGTASTKVLVTGNVVFDTGAAASYRLTTYGVSLDATTTSCEVCINEATETKTAAVLNSGSQNLVEMRMAGPGKESNGDLQLGGYLRVNGSAGSMLLSGTGTPAGSVSAPVGSIYMRAGSTDGYTQWYVKTLGTGSTGWRPVQDELDAGWFGAVADGTTDDTAALQSTFAAAAALVTSMTNVAYGSCAGVLDVRIPRGRCRYVGNTNLITAPGGGIIAYGLRVVGYGADVSMIQWEPTSGARRYLFDLSDVSFAKFQMDGVGIQVSNAHPQAVAIRTTATTNGPQDMAFKKAAFYNLAHVWVAAGSDLSSEVLWDNCRFLGDENIATLAIEGTDQTLNVWVRNCSWLVTKGSFIRAVLGGNIFVNGCNAFNTASTSTGTSGTACGSPIYCNGAAAAGAYPNIRTALGNFSEVSGMIIRWADGQIFTTNANQTFSSSADTAQPTAATLASPLRDKTPGVVYPRVQLSANANINDTTVSLLLVGGPTTATLVKGDVLKIGTTDTATYVVQANTTINNVGVGVPILPVVVANTASGQDVHCREPAIFELLGNTHARGVCNAAFRDVRIEHRNRSSRTFYCEWALGAVTFENFDESSQTTSVGPMWTHRIDLGNVAGPRMRFSRCIFHGWPDIFYGSSAYDRHASINYEQCQWRIGNDWQVGFSYVPKSTVNSTVHTTYGGKPLVRIRDCKGDNALSTDSYVGNADMNAQTAYRPEVSPQWLHLRHQAGTSPPASTTLQAYLPLGAIITKVKLFLRPGVAAATAGTSYTVKTSDGTNHAVATPATLDLGFNMDVQPTNGAHVCDTDAKRLVQLVTNAAVPAQYQDFYCSVEYFGG